MEQLDSTLRHAAWKDPFRIEIVLSTVTSFAIRPEVRVERCRGFADRLENVPRYRQHADCQRRCHNDFPDANRLGSIQGTS